MTENNDNAASAKTAGAGEASSAGEVAARPDAAIETAFGDRSDLADQYHSWLAEHATVRV